MSLKFWLQRLWCKAVLLTVLVFGVALNGIAWMQARAMTHYVASGERTARLDKSFLPGKAWIMLTGVRLPRPTNRLTPQYFRLPYETHNIALPQGERLEAWFIAAKVSRGVVLLFPPYTGSKQGLLASSKIFHDLGYDTLLVDFRGVGGSSGSDTTLGVREAKDVAYAMGYVQQKWSGRPIVLYGASMGSVAVMRAIAHEGIKPTAVILESPFDRLLNTVRHRFEVIGVPPFPGSELVVAWGGVQQGIDGFAHNPVEYAKAIQCPVLLMYGKYDRLVTLPEVESIVTALPGRKQLVVFSSVGHGAFARDNPAQWKQTVQQFLYP